MARANPRVVAVPLPVRRVRKTSQSQASRRVALSSGFSLLSRTGTSSRTADRKLWTLGFRASSAAHLVHLDKG